MEETFDFKTQTISLYVESKDYSALTCYLKESFKLLREENGAPIQYPFSPDLCKTLIQLLKTVVNDLVFSDTLFVELFRSLRNYVINPSVQQYLSSDIDFLNNITKLTTTETPGELLKIVLQFLINLVISNKAGAVNVHSVFFNSLKTLLQEKLNVYETSALLYNISLHQKLQLDYDLYCCIIDLYKSDDKVEFLYFLIEAMIKDEDFWLCYKLMSLEVRITALEIITNIQIKDNELDIPELAVTTLLNIFINSGNVIFQTVCNSESNLEPYEVSKTLQILTSLCSKENYLKILQRSKDLLINSAALLINIHQLGKQSDNNFSSIQKLADLRNPSSEISDHPAFGFKADLIRLVANLCWKNKIMQDLVRETEIIPIILDCCNVDARNPFIMQWSILAVRNLCDGNLENQKIIAGMHQQGVVSNRTLEEFGVTLKGDNNNSFSIVPLDALKDSSKT